MSERGNYRSIYTAIVDGPDFQALSPGAKLVWYTLKMTLGPSGIDVVPALVPTLVERTGAPVNHVERALAQLTERGWVQLERNVVWMIEGLRHDPHFSLTNQNHRIQIAKHLNGLPRLAIVDAFRAHYGFAPPPSEMPSTPAEHGLHDGAKMPSKKPSKMASTIREKGEGKREKGHRLSAAGAAGSSRAGRPTWLTPFAEAWRARYGGEMSAGKAVKALARLVEQHGTEEVERRWGIYLAATAAEYANAPKFAETWGRWSAPVLHGASDLPSAASAHLARATTLWGRYRQHALLTRWPREEYERIGATLVSAGDYPDVDAFLAELRVTEPWTLADARTDGWAINQLALRLSAHASAPAPARAS